MINTALMPTGCTFNPCVGSPKIQILWLKKELNSDPHLLLETKTERPCFMHTNEILHSVHQTCIQSCYGPETILTSMLMIY